MNFLAHAHLSGDNDEIVFGNFIADAVKGNEMNSFSTGVRKGIQLHRKIDAFTDSHPYFKRSVESVRHEFGKFGGVAVDIFYDHFLATSWQSHHHQTLRQFADNVYGILQSNYDLLPIRTKRLLPFLVTQNWLVGYANMSELKLVFYGMDRRTKFRSGMIRGVKVLKNNYESIRNDFNQFYPELVDYSSEQLNTLLNNEISDRL